MIGLKQSVAFVDNTDFHRMEEEPLPSTPAVMDAVAKSAEKVRRKKSSMCTIIWFFGGNLSNHSYQWE
jgi:hypothetical protein